MVVIVTSRPPSAQDDSYTTYKNTPLNVAAPGVLGNDSDPDGDPLTAVLVSPPSQGSLTLNANGSFTYTPPAGWSGTTTFTYKARDVDGAESNVATVTITVQNRAPTAQNDSYTTYKNTPLNVAAPGVLGNDSDPDGDPLTAVLVSPPSQGSLTLNANGSFTYTPPAGWSGTTTFTYKARDVDGAESNVATVTITVLNRAPIAEDDAYSTLQGRTLNVRDGQPGSFQCWLYGGLGIGSVLCNDSDPDGDLLTARLVIPPEHAVSFELRPGGGFTYTPDPNYYGIDTFVYRAVDSDGAWDEAKVTIIIEHVDNPVDAVDDSYTTDEDAPVSGNVLGNDSYPDGLGSVNVVSGPGNGTLTLNPDGSFIYTPAPNFHGTDTVHLPPVR